MNYAQSRWLHLVLGFVAFPAGAIVSAALAHRYGLGLLLAGVAWTIFIEWATRRIKCQNCGRPIGFGRFKFLGIQFEWWKAIPAKSCEYSSDRASVTRAGSSIWSFILAVVGWAFVGLGTIVGMASEQNVPCGPECNDFLERIRDLVKLPMVVSGVLILAGISCLFLRHQRRRRGA